MHAYQLRTERLLMRAPVMEDAAAIQELVSAWEIARATLHIPHPYPENGAEEWLKRSEDNLSRGIYTFGLTLKSDGSYIGTMGLHVDDVHQHAEVGYWIGVPYWNQGYATEALTRLIQFGFKTVGLQRIFAQYFADNPASRRVMEKSGMNYEGTMRQHIQKWAEFKDLGICGIVRADWESRHSG
jgi:RimJ/RimL family protein N-acetyltransferase